MLIHPQLGAVESIIADLEGLLGAALANREMDLVVSYATALEYLQRTCRLLRLKGDQD